MIYSYYTALPWCIWVELGIRKLAWSGGCLVTSVGRQKKAPATTGNSMTTCRTQKRDGWSQAHGTAHGALGRLWRGSTCPAGPKALGSQMPKLETENRWEGAESSHMAGCMGQLLMLRSSIGSQYASCFVVKPAQWSNDAEFISIPVMSHVTCMFSFSWIQILCSWDSQLRSKCNGQAAKASCTSSW